MVQQLSPFSIDEDILYPESDGKPLADNTIQFRLIVTIQGGLDTLFRDRDDVFVAGDLFWYPLQLTPQEIQAKKQPKRQAPDVMVAFGRPKGDRPSYKQWREENIPPQVVFEILSPGNRKKEMDNKFQFYQRYGVEEYYLYNPMKNRLQGWLRKGNKLEPILQTEGWKSPRLGIKFSIAEGELALFYPNGDRFASYVELSSQRDIAKTRADRAETRADIAETRADRAEATIEEERRKNQQLRDRLQQLGIDPD
jgi:Uma2 family endonuclease